MPAVGKDHIWCTCCKKFLTRKREHEHRQAATKPYIPPVTSYRQFAFLSALFSDDEDDIPALATVDPREDDEDLYHSKSPSPGDDFEETSEETSEPVLDPMDVDIHLYTQMGTLDIIDITSVQALVGRVKSQVSGGAWAIIDRSGALARAIYEEELDVDE